MSFLVSVTRNFVSNPLLSFLQNFHHSDIRRLSCFSVFHQPYLLILSWLPDFLSFIFFSWSMYQSFIIPTFRACFYSLIRINIIFFYYRVSSNFISLTFVSYPDFQSFIFVIFLYFLPQIQSLSCTGSELNVRSGICFVVQIFIRPKMVAYPSFQTLNGW